LKPSGIKPRLIQVQILRPKETQKSTSTYLQDRESKMAPADTEISGNGMPQELDIKETDAHSLKVTGEESDGVKLVEKEKVAVNSLAEVIAAEDGRLGQASIRDIQPSRTGDEIGPEGNQPYEDSGGDMHPEEKLEHLSQKKIQAAETFDQQGNRAKDKVCEKPRQADDKSDQKGSSAGTAPEAKGYQLGDTDPGVNDTSGGLLRNTQKEMSAMPTAKLIGGGTNAPLSDEEGNKEVQESEEKPDKEKHQDNARAYQGLGQYEECSDLVKVKHQQSKPSDQEGLDEGEECHLQPAAEDPHHNEEQQSSGNGGNEIQGDNQLEHQSLPRPSSPEASLSTPQPERNFDIITPPLNSNQLSSEPAPSPQSNETTKVNRPRGRPPKKSSPNEPQQKKDSQVPNPTKESDKQRDDGVDVPKKRGRGRPKKSESGVEVEKGTKDMGKRKAEGKPSDEAGSKKMKGRQTKK
jgi:hypothetical protein